MNLSRNILPAVCAVFLVSCGMAREKAALYYLSKAEKIITSESAAPADIEKAYRLMDKALRRAPSSARALVLLEELGKKAYGNGFERGGELETDILKEVVRVSPDNLSASLALITVLNERGDVPSMRTFSALLEGRASPDFPGRAYGARLLMMSCLSAMAQWLEADGFIALNRDAGLVQRNAADYVGVVEKIKALKSELAAEERASPALRKSVPEGLRASAEITSADVLAEKAEFEKIKAGLSLMASDAGFKKAFELTVEGNKELVKKNYSSARAFYQGALANYPAFVDAKKQQVEVDFQEGASLAIANENRRSARALLLKAYQGSESVIAAGLSGGNRMPFMTTGRFMSEIYALRAAVISAYGAVEKPGAKQRARMENNFKAALDASLKFNPNNRIARELLERYAKEGF